MGENENLGQEDLFAGPGDQLKRARLQSGLDVETVAKQLCLTKTRVLSIENDDYSKAGALIYVKGYLRSYAKLVGLDCEPILEDFAKLNLSEQINQYNEILIAPKQREAVSKKRMRLITIAIAAVLISLVFVWLHNTTSS